MTSNILFPKNDSETSGDRPKPSAGKGGKPPVLPQGRAKGLYDEQLQRQQQERKLREGGKAALLGTKIDEPDFLGAHG
jgi:hypothetical protein